MPDRPRPVTVRGGAGGIEAHYDDMVDAARLFGAAAAELSETALALHRYLVDPGLLTGGLLDPGGTVHAEASLASALDGAGGITRLALRCAALDVRLRAAAAAYEATDRVATRASDLLGGVVALPGAVGTGARTFATTGDPGRAAQRIVASDPAIADSLVNVLGGVRGGAALVATGLLRDGRPVVRALGRDPADEAGRPPRTIHDLIDGLALRNDARNGAVDVRILTRPDGTRAAVVDIPGTKSWQVLPNHDVTSVATDARAIAGRSSAYERGVLDALTRAGVRPTDDVMLVGHSEGGLVAVQAATDARRSGRFHVTHVVTAGAPIGAIAGDVPSTVQVLALENTPDVVPHTDGRTNPDRTNITTVTGTHEQGTILGNHDLRRSYLPLASDADASGAVSVRAFVRSAGAFFDAASVDTQRFVITRA